MIKYAKIIDDEIEYITNCNINEGLIEFDDEKIKYPIYFNNKIVEGYNEDIANYLKNKITIDELKNKMIEKLREKYITMFRQTDDYIIMREKRKLLGIWTEKDEHELQQKMEEYNELVTEYKQRKQECLELLNDKQGLIDYYKNTLLPRLNELYNC